MERHLVVMARAPRVGTVKRRLTRDIGSCEAWRFYRVETGRLLRRLGRDSRWRLWLALTPDPVMSEGRPWPFRGRIIGQGRGDLGRRMARLLREMPRGPLVIVGSDIPAIEVSDIAEAFRALGRKDWVIGPAPDGGYWLIGARRRPRVITPFAGVRWSSRHALKDTVGNLDDWRIAWLRSLADIDTGADYRRWLKALTT